MIFTRCAHIVFTLYAGILTPSDEFQYWADLSNSAEKNSVRERATHITEQFKPIQKVCMQTFIYQEWLQGDIYYMLFLYVYRVSPLISWSKKDITSWNILLLYI